MKKAFALAAAVLILLYAGIAPSNDREWSPDQAVLPTAEFADDTVRIRNIRNFSYSSETEYVPAWYDKTFDLSEIKRAYYVVEPFSGHVGAAHTFLSFEFEGGDFVAVSVEIRKEKGEAFSAFKGLLKQYEIMYVVADERDAIKLRSNFRRDQVYVYPVKAEPERVRRLFVGMLERANKLAAEPEFYNTLTNTCTTNIVRHVNRISPKRIPWSWKALLPAYSDELAYELGLLDIELPLEEARQRFLINERAEKYADDPAFSLRIRE